MSIKAAVRDALPRHYQVPLKYWYGVARRFHEPEMTLLQFLVKPGARVLDVGGNRGTYAYVLHKLGAKVEVFEPHPACVATLSDWAERMDRVTIHPVALSDATGEAVLHVPVDEHGVAHDASASVEGVTNGQKTQNITVPLRTLDSFGFRDVEFIKIDTEGHEGRVIAGAEETIKATKPALLIEIEQRHLSGEKIQTVFDRITDWGYRGFFLHEGRLKPLKDFSVTQHQSMRAFETGGLYLNNFLFLNAADLGRDRYGKLAMRWMDSGSMFA